jgi:AbrB family looped-hinge helix DNA binding protein|tara:strand:+ start:512 stop:739 length:228 start_codon:yes stop_codon:yes gene_type:complete
MDKIAIDTTRLSAKGQVVIPVDVRNKLQLKTGNRLLVVSSENSIILQKVDSVKQDDDYSLLKYAKNIANKIGIKI